MKQQYSSYKKTEQVMLLWQRQVSIMKTLSTWQISEQENITERNEILRHGIFEADFRIMDEIR
jgi:hypothetical protein